MILFLSMLSDWRGSHGAAGFRVLPAVPPGQTMNTNFPPSGGSILSGFGLVLGLRWFAIIMLIAIMLIVLVTTLFDDVGSYPPVENGPRAGASRYGVVVPCSVPR